MRTQKQAQFSSKQTKTQTKLPELKQTQQVKKTLKK